MSENTRDLLALAQDILDMTRQQLFVNLRFLDQAIHACTPVPVQDQEQPDLFHEAWTMDTNGQQLLYHPRRLLRLYRSDPGALPRLHMHTLLHCLFRHMFNGVVDDISWELACDMAVHAVMRDLGCPLLASARDALRNQQLDRLQAAGVRRMTAEFIYRHLRDHPLSEWDVAALQLLFAEDSHHAWYAPPLPDASSRNASSSDGADSSPALTREDAARRWRDISEHMQTGLETLGHLFGSGAGNLLQSLGELNRERYDYSDFLRRFTAPCEVTRLSEDEFDYIYYSYGLSHYGNIPLIEPLEYREGKLIHDLVIAIDTSGSTFGELVQRFLQKTYNIIKQQEHFARRFNLHIIQCDAGIQEDAHIASQEEFDAYLKRMKIRGGGGTDFRPVFAHVEKLRERGAFRNLRGLIYFTDGMGAYPEKRTDYQTAFVFLEGDAYCDRHVPPWAMKLILDEDQLN